MKYGYVDGPSVQYRWSVFKILTLAKERWAHDQRIVMWCRRMLRRAW